MIVSKFEKVDVEALLEVPPVLCTDRFLPRQVLAATGSCRDWLLPRCTIALHGAPFNLKTLLGNIPKFVKLIKFIKLVELVKLIKSVELI